MNEWTNEWIADEPNFRCLPFWEDRSNSSVLGKQSKVLFFSSPSSSPLPLVLLAALEEGLRRRMVEAVKKQKEENEETAKGKTKMRQRKTSRKLRRMMERDKTANLMRLTVTENDNEWRKGKKGWKLRLRKRKWEDHGKKNDKKQSKKKSLHVDEMRWRCWMQRHPWTESKPRRK